LQPCPNRTLSQKEFIENPNLFEVADKSNKNRAGKKYTPYVCTQDDKHLFHLAKKQDTHYSHIENATRKFLSCAEQPCPHRLNNDTRAALGYEACTKENEPEHELSEEEGEEEPETQGNKAPGEPIPIKVDEEPTEPKEPEPPKQPEDPEPEPDTMVEDKTPKEIRLNPPTSFDGTKSKFKAFRQAVDLYLLLNQKIYDNDDKKIAFTLSYLSEGEAAAWRQAYVDSVKQPDNTYKFGEHKDFEKLLKDAFAEADEAGEALFQLKHLKQGKKTADEHVSEFKIILSQTGLLGSNHAALADDKKKEDPGDIAAREYFMESLNEKLLQKILFAENVPETLEGFYKKAILFDNQWRRAKRIFDRKPGNNRSGGSNQNNGGRHKWNFSQPKKDPNAMDVDTMTLDERTELMKQGKCFYCRNTGHIASACPQKTNKTSNPKDGKKKFTPKEAYTQVRALLANYSENEMDEFHKHWEEGEDF
jgi:hypothetical protein